MFSLFIDYNKWHYSYAIVNIFRLAREFIRFSLNLFSVNLFLKSLFRPIFSIPVDDVDSENITDVGAVFIGGVVLRIVGAIFRLFFILLGLLFSFFTVIFFSCILVAWIIMPLIFVAVAYYFISLSLLII